MSDTQTITQTIDHSLVRNGLSVAGAAAKADVSRNSIYRLRSGDRVNRDIVGKIAAALDLDPVDLWTSMNAAADAAAASTKDAA